MTRKSVYTIHVAAELCGLHEQSLRMYERRGLIRPRRSNGNIRLFSEEDLERIRLIRRLVDDLGVNLAGVEVILSMREQLLELQRQLERTERRLAQLLHRDDRRDETGRTTGAGDGAWSR